MKAVLCLSLPALLFFCGCSEEKPKVVLKENNAAETVFKGRVVCPFCRLVLADGDVKILNQQMLLCLKCKKSAPKIRFYPDAKKSR